MVFVAEAFAGWLVGQVADASRKRMGILLLGSDQERALQEAATAAIRATAQQIRLGPEAVDDPQGAEHLARVIDQVFQQPQAVEESLTGHPTLLQGLQAGVIARLAVLDDADITGTQSSSAELLGISVRELTDLLIGQLLRELVMRGAGGGPLAPLADQLNHDLTHLQGLESRASHRQHGASLARLIADMQSALATLRRLDQQTQSIPAPAPPGLVRTTRLEELERACRARMVGSWQALGVPRQLAIQLAEDPAVGRPPGAAVPLPGGVRLLLGDMGAGKTLMGERLHQAALTRARQDVGAPVPIYLTARRAREGLREAVEAEAQGLGHPRRQGAVVVVDGADEAGADVAADLLDEARRLVIEWPRTSVVLASRLLPYLSEAEEGWTVPPLTNDEAELLLARIEGGRQGSFRGLTGLPPAVRDAVHRPLFTVLLGTFLLGESGRFPRSRSELVRSLVDRSLRRTAGRWRHAQTLLERLAQLTIDRAGAVLATEVGLSKDREALIATGLVAEHSGALSFPLPILEQWFAAQLLLGDPERTATLARDLPLLERWRYAIVLALAEANQGVATQLLQPIVLEQPAVASTLVHEGLADRREDDTLPLPPSRECGEQVRAAMAAWVEGIGPLVELVAPVDSDGRLLPLGARSDGVRLLTAWYRGNEPKHDVDELEINEVLLSPQRSGWILGPDGVPSRSAGWAWHWTLKQLSREIKELVQKQRLPIHEGPLADEANWRLARSLDAGIPRSPHPSPIPLSRIEARLAQVSDTTALVVRGHGTLKAADLKAWLQRLHAMGIETVAYPWPGPDLDPDPQAGVNWDWEFYSDPRLLEWAQAVYAGALRGYQDLVEQWFAPFASRLRTAALLPARLVGAVDPPTRDGTGKDMPGITWYLEPLPVGSTTHVELAIGEHPGFTWEDMKQASHRFRRLRPHASPWLGGSWHESVIPNLFAPDPATSLAYDWLRNDLRDTHWIS
jgi:hypothetical protein